MSKPATVVGIDGSEKAEQALLWYLSEIHRPENRVVLVHCEEPFVPMFTMAGGAATAEAYNHMLQESKAHSHKIEEKYKVILNDRQVEGKIISVFSAKPGETIVQKATEEHAQMIVMGTRGMGVVRRTLLGSISDYVVHHAHCPVLVCREPHMTEGGIEGAK